MHNFSDLKFGRQNFEMMKDFLGSGTENPRVGSSILPLGTIDLIKKIPAFWLVFLCLKFTIL